MLFALVLSAATARPTDGGGMWTYDDTDSVTSLDGPGGLVRVWYSTTGTNAVLATDADENGLPDFAEDVAVTAEAVLEGFDTLGVSRPLPDHGKGGDDRLDAYLVDFGGNSDGNWATEGCDGSECYGYFQMENDFSDYGYPSLHSAVSVLTSHELFHGVQAAYGSTDAVWFSEGTATWSEDYFEPEVDDFLSLCGAYLEDTGRSLSEPPSGPVPAFAYGTALWWWYLTNHYGDSMMVDLVEAMGTAADDDALLAGMSEVETAHGGSLREDFVTFTAWNLATSARAGGMESYPFAADLRGLKAEANGDVIVDDNRFYALSATYYTLETQADTELFVATSEAGPDLSIRVYPVDGTGNVLDSIADIPADGAAHDVGISAAGTYWLVVSNPTLAANSTKLTVCFGAQADMASCAVNPDTGDTGDTGAVDTADIGSPDSAADTGDGSPGGCACSATSAGAGGTTSGVLASVVGLLTIRRRRSSARR